MLPYGWDGSEYRVLTVDDEGHLQILVVGTSYQKWGLYAWWRFMESEGTIIIDHSGRGNDGIAYSGETPQANYVTGKVGKALLFDGTDDFVNCGLMAGMMVLSGSIELWFNPTVTIDNTTTLIMPLSQNRVQFRFLADDGRLAFRVYDEPDEVYRLVYSTRNTWVAGTWYHVVGTWSPTGLKLYVNGVLVDSEDNDAYPEETIQTFHIGCTHGASLFFAGIIDEVRVYLQALTAGQVLWRYNNYAISYLTQTQPVAVDEAGRMEVNILDLPYKDTVMIFKDVNDHAAGTVKIESDPVPDGKLWVITNSVCRCMLDSNGATSLYIRRGDDYYMIAELMRAATFDTLNFNGYAYLKAGDILACWFSAVDVNKSCQVYANGYSLDAP